MFTWRSISVCLVVTGCSHLSAAGPTKEETDALRACAQAVLSGLRKIADTRDLRFQGKVSEANALCRGGYRALQFRDTPWVDWANYWGTGDDSSLPQLAPVVSKAVATR